jgi:hypothetical protein
METSVTTNGRGRPKKLDALTNAERQKRYRDKAKETGQVKRYVTLNGDVEDGTGQVKRDVTLNRDIEDENGYLKPTYDQLLAMYAENVNKLMDAERSIAYLKEKSKRQDQRNDQLQAELATECSNHTLTLKELRNARLSNAK